jgi:hypothetical protein
VASDVGGVIEHSSIVGGSSAGKRMQCPGSYQMEQKLPPEARGKTSAYAEEGSALHDCIAYILDSELDDIDEVRGMEFRGYVITQEHMDTAIRPAIDFLDGMIEEAERRGEGPLQFLVEKRCEFPGIPDAFGTSDIIFRTSKRAGIVDWKFGAGVPVAALTPDDKDGDLINAQLAYYARSAMHSFPGFFGDNKEWPVELVIVQPLLRADLATPLVPDEQALASHADGMHGLTYVMVSQGELEDFRMQLVHKIAEATAPNPTIKKGSHCRFAACKAICPLHIGAALDLSKLAKRKEEMSDVTVVVGDDPWGDFYAAALDVKHAADLFFDEVAQQAHRRLESGLPVPGWKLVPKRPTATYIDEAGAVRHAIGLGVNPDDVYAPRQVKSPAQLRDTIEPLMEGKTKKERKEKAQADIDKFAPKVSSGTTLAIDDDARAGKIAAGAAVAALGQKLAALPGR